MSKILIGHGKEPITKYDYLKKFGHRTMGNRMKKLRSKITDILDSRIQIFFGRVDLYSRDDLSLEKLYDKAIAFEPLEVAIAAAWLREAAVSEIRLTRVGTPFLKSKGIGETEIQAFMKSELDARIEFLMDIGVIEPIPIQEEAETHQPAVQTVFLSLLDSPK